MPAPSTSALNPAGISLLPPNATPLERVFDALLHSRIGAVETAYRAFWSPADCPASMLPWLAWAVSVDEWDPAWSENVRRAQIARAIPAQRRKGTASSVKTIISGLGGTVSLKEWWQMDPPANPHTFDLAVSLSSGTGPPSTAFIDGVIRAVEAAKPLRSHFTFSLSQNFNGAIGLRGGVRAAVLARVSMIAPPA